MGGSVRALLDTHVLLWALMQPEKLSDAAREVILDRRTELLVSAVTGWEISTKVRLGKLPDASHLVHDYSAHVQRLRAISLPVTAEHSLLAGALRWEHRDPFDRMLAAQSMLENVPLITSDSALSALPVLQALW